LAGETILIEAHAITRRAAQRNAVLLHETDFRLGKGERVALTGPSGSGKSVFLRALALLDPLDGGEIRWQGRHVDAARVPDFRRHIAYIRQRPALLDGTVEDNLRYPYTLRAYRGQAYDADRARQLLIDAGRDAELLSRATPDLSGGEAQIVALVRVLQLDPQALLLDEPTAALDPDSARAVESLVARWFALDTGNRATIWISHDPAQALRVGTRHITMHAGVLDTTLPAMHEEALP
jgi:putative ABC transport system ATP-binding protein